MHSDHIRRRHRLAAGLAVVCGSFVLAAKIGLEWCGDLLQDFLFPMALPDFYVPFFGMLIGGTVACWLVPRTICRPLAQTIEGGSAGLLGHRGSHCWVLVVDR